MCFYLGDLALPSSMFHCCLSDRLVTTRTGNKVTPAGAQRLETALKNVLTSNSSFRLEDLLLLTTAFK